MKNAVVELRDAKGRVTARMSADVYREAREAGDPDVEAGTATLVQSCPVCKTQHDIMTWDDLIALAVGGAQAEYSRACVVAARGGQ